MITYLLKWLRKSLLDSKAIHKERHKMQKMQLKPSLQELEKARSSKNWSVHMMFETFRLCCFLTHRKGENKELAEGVKK